MAGSRRRSPAPPPSRRREVTAMTDVAAPREPYLADFARVEQEFHGDDPAWLRETRRKALATFRELGFPTQKHEMWKYTNVAPITRTRFTPAVTIPGNGLPAEKLEPVVFWKFDASELVVVNGRFSRALSSVRGVADGVRRATSKRALRGRRPGAHRNPPRTGGTDANPSPAWTPGSPQMARST